MKKEDREDYGFLLGAFTTYLGDSWELRNKGKEYYLGGSDVDWEFKLIPDRVMEELKKFFPDLMPQELPYQLNPIELNSLHSLITNINTINKSLWDEIKGVE